MNRSGVTTLDSGNVQFVGKPDSASVNGSRLSLHSELGRGTRKIFRDSRAQKTSSFDLLHAALLFEVVPEINLCRKILPTAVMLAAASRFLQI